MSKYHLYHRVSKAVQSEQGHGIDRQQQGSEIWIENHNKKRVDEGLPSYSRGQIYEDRGRSGYTSANLKKGELGQLMNDIERGFIAKGDIIVIELIDRFSRAKPDFVRKQFEKILTAGVKIAITKWDIVFEEDMQGIEGVSARVLLEISIYLANQESSQKSARIRASNKTMKDKGMKHIAKTPIWLARSPDRKGHEVIPQNAEIIQKIFELKLERGWGALRIMNELRELEAKGNLKGFVSVDEKPNLILARYTYNDEGELVQGALNSPLAESTVNAILRNKNVIGSLNDQPIYYPPIVDEAVYL
ncbi:recombinase family protein [Vibrio olivae]|uniref:Recombinase family protein n=1 Tax=Vibrio olivae TaxID=1243002 RepID=A0ABV5HPY8_9VIBR